MADKNRMERLGRADLEALAEKALTTKERNRQASAKVRQAKKAAGLQQLVVWVPKGAPEIAKIREFTEQLCEKHLRDREGKR